MSDHDETTMTKLDRAGARWLDEFHARFNPVWVVVVHKVAFLATVLIMITLVPSIDKRAFDSFISWPLDGDPNFSTRWTTWDGAQYLYLAEVGYTAGEESAAFYPTVPFLIRGISAVVGGYEPLVGLVLMNSFAAAAFVFFHKYVAAIWGAVTANYALLWLLVFPGALFFGFIYTEGLFLLLVMLFFLSLENRRFVALAVVGFLLPLTKALGILMIIPAVWYAWEAKLDRRAYLAACLGPAVGYLAYLALMYRLTGNPFEGFEAQSHFPNEPSIANVFDIPGLVGAFFDVEAGHQPQTSPIDRAFFLLVVALLPSVWRLGKTYFLYVGLVGILPALTNWFLSYTRFVVMAFPIFVLLAQLSSKSRRWGRFLAVVGVAMVLLQAYLLVHHISFYWAG